MRKSKIINNDLISRKKILTYSIFAIIFIGTSFLSVFFMYTHFHATSSFLTFKFLKPSIIIYLVVLLFLYYLLDTLRFYYVFKTLKIKIDFLYLYKVNFINTFLSNITPFATGGAFAQVYYLNKKDIPLGDATAVTTIKTILPIIFFFITTPIVLITDKTLVTVFPDSNNLLSIVILIAIYIILIYLSYALLQNTRIVKKMVYRTLYFLEHKNVISNTRAKKVRGRTFKEIDTFTLSMKRFSKGNKLYIFLSASFTVLFLLTLYMFPVVLIKGFGYNVSLVKLIPIQIVLTFVTYFAPTPGATGVAEGGFTLIFSNYVDQKDIVPITFWWRFFTMYLGMIVGLVFFYIEIVKRRLKLTKLGSAP